MAADTEPTKWNCDGCTFENDCTQNPHRCAMCNTPKDYLIQSQKSKDIIINKYKKKYGKELLSYFYPYPDTKGCNSGNTAVHAIIDNVLYLSGSYIAQNMKWLKEKKIGAILNCASTDIKHNEKVYTKQNGIILKQLPIHDSSKWKSTMNKYIEEAIMFIMECIETNKMSVLIHCSAGISRSSTVLIAYLMKVNQWDLLQSFKFVKSKRNYIYPNLAFWELLIDLNNKGIEDKNNSKDSVDEKDCNDCNDNNDDEKLLSMDILVVHAENLGKMKGSMYSSVRTEKVNLW